MKKYTIRKSKVYFELWQIFLGPLPYKSGLYFAKREQAEDYLGKLQQIKTEQDEVKQSGRY